jgi:NAD(P)-dependent dehydrogenase (short-subunit alcohol dehydrogenase family)
LKDRALLIIGAGQGIGRSAAHHLTRAGCALALVDLEADRVEAVAAELRAQGGNAHPLVGDVTDEASAEETVASAAKALGRIDGLVNIVGAAGWASLLEIDSATWDKEFLLNLKQHFFVCRAVARRMIDQGDGGTIVTVASVSGLFGAPKHGAYGAAKAGLMALTKTMSEEWAEYGIRVNTVSPGSVLTPRIAAMRESGELPAPKPGEVDRMCETDDIAGAIFFLSSNLARRVNGHTLIVDGGTTSLFPFDMS